MTTQSNISSQNSENFCSNSCRDEKVVRFPKKLFVEMFVWTSKMKSLRACRNIVGKKTKNSRKFQKRRRYIFLNKLISFFIKNVSVAKDNAFLRTLAKKVLQKPTDSQLRFQKPRKNLGVFRKEKNFPPNVPTYMQNAVVTTLPKFSRQNYENFLLEFRKWWKTDKISWKPTCKFVHLNKHNEISTLLP